MYDTINMYYQFDDNPIPSIEDLFKNCTNVSHTERENSNYMQGDLKNLRITLNEGSISVQYRGEPTVLSNFSVRILNADGDVTNDVQSKSCIFLQLTRAEAQPPQ